MIFPVKVYIPGKYSIKVAIGDSINEDDVIGVLDEDGNPNVIIEPENGNKIEELVETLPRWIYSKYRPTDNIDSTQTQVHDNSRAASVSGITELFATFEQLFRVVSRRR